MKIKKTDIFLHKFTYFYWKSTKCEPVTHLYKNPVRASYPLGDITFLRSKSQIRNAISYRNVYPPFWLQVYVRSYRFHLRAIDDNFQFSCACVPFEYFNLGGGATISIYFMSPESRRGSRDALTVSD